MAGFDPTLSAIIFLVSSWANLVLYFTELLSSIYFFKHRKATRLYKLYVAGALLVDTISTIAVLANAYLFLVIYPMTLNYPTQQIWTLPVQLITTYASGLFEQLFLVYRCWRLTSNNYIASALLVLVVVHFGFALTSAFWVVAHPQYTVDFGLTATTINVSLSAATDLLIGAVLVWKLYTFETFYDSTKSLVNRIALISISSGVICSITSVIMLILLLTNSTVFELFFSCLGRIYTLTILFNFFTIRAKNLSSGIHIHGTSDRVPVPQESIQFGDVPSLDVPRSRIIRIEGESSETGGVKSLRLGESDSSTELSEGTSKMSRSMGITS